MGSIPTPRTMEPTERQVLGAKIRAAEEAFVLKHRKPCAGGFNVPSRKAVYGHLAKMFQMSSVEVSYFLSYSRSCTHKWSEGACVGCPE